MPRQLDVKPGERILVSRTDRLGDLILVLPLVDSLKARFPESTIDILASSYAAPILAGHASIGEVIPVDSSRLGDKSYRDEMVKQIASKNYSIALAVYPEKEIARLLKDCRIPHRIGTAGRLHSFYFNHRWFHRRSESNRHEVEYNLEFLRFFAEGPIVHTPTINLSPAELTAARQLLQTNGIARPFVVLHPGAGGSADIWPLERFVELSDILITAGKEIVISGSAQEKAVFLQAWKGRDRQPKVIAGQTDLRTLAAVLSMAAVVVANSTGPLHLAAAVSARVVGLFPNKKVMSPRRWGPLGEGHRVIQPAAAICRCKGGRCECMFSITAHQVSREVQAIWAEGAQRKLQT